MIKDCEFLSKTLRTLVNEGLDTWPADKLVNFFKYDPPLVHALVSRHMHTRGDRIIFEQVSDFQNSPEDYMREICAFVLGQLGTPNRPYRDESIPILLKLTTDNSSDVRATTAEAIGHLYHNGMTKEVQEALCLLASDPDENVRSSVARALKNATDNKKIRDTLDRLLEDSKEKVREDAKESISILDGKVK